jgi:hypothetical protein
MHACLRTTGLVLLLLTVAGCQRSTESANSAPSAKPAETQAAAPGESRSIDDALLKSRAVDAVLWSMPAVNYELMRQQMLTKTTGKVGDVIYWGKPLDWHNQTLTPNPDTMYFMTFFDLREGPIVLDFPPANGGSLNANTVTGWQMPLEDAGLLGIDKGKGVKLLILPPGWKGTPPAGYLPLQSDTLGGYSLWRSNLKSHADADVDASVAYAKKVKVYPLSQASNPPANNFIDVNGIDFDATIQYDASYFDHLNQFVQDNPWIDRDRVMIDRLATLGIVKGKPFNPDAKTREVFDAAARDAHALIEERYDKGWEPFFANTQWRPAAEAAFVKSGSSGYADTDEYPIDSRGMTYSYGYVGIKRLGAGQFYLIAIKDKDGNALEGSKTYRLHVPPNVPVKQYWSVTVYDRETHALVRNMSRASRASNSSEVQKNGDGSVDIFFGPTAPAGKERNWVPTDPKRQFELMFRLYGPTPELMAKSWTLPDVEVVQ